MALVPSFFSWKTLESGPFHINSLEKVTIILYRVPEINILLNKK